MVNLRVDASHQHDVVIVTGNKLSGVSQRIGATKFLETDQVGELGSQIEEQVLLGFKNRSKGCCKSPLESLEPPIELRRSDFAEQPEKCRVTTRAG